MPQHTALVVFGTRPEVIKLAPVIRAIGALGAGWRSVQLSSSQHTDLLYPFARTLGVEIHHDLAVMQAGQTPEQVLARVTSGVTRVIEDVAPTVVVVQGDTTTAFGAALAGFYRRVPVAHVEAGLRTGDPSSPFPEEMHRRLIGQLTDLHLAATPRNVATLHAEGVPPDRVVLTGNPVVDALHWMREHLTPSPALGRVLDAVGSRRILALTTHRRENFGDIMRGHLSAIRQFVREHDDVAVVFPVHPNPNVRQVAAAVLEGEERVHLVDPLDYGDFVHLLSRAWLICSDSGGVQEEAPSLGKPVLILRDTTERPEVLECGVGRLTGHSGPRLLEMLRECAARDDWATTAAHARNPFGFGDAGGRIAAALATRYADARTAG